MIEVFLSLKVALRALRVNKLRSSLTMLGIIIGIASVIVMIAIGSGANQLVAEQIASIGSNLILIIPGTTTSGGLRAGAGSVPTLTYDDVRAIGNECPAVALVAPTVRGTAQVVYGNMNWSTLLGAVASISLIVGGIGIMNIMLVSVTERTREIGIRMAIGAKQRDILLQFLTEAVTITIVGGIAGMVIGVGVAAAVSRLFSWPTLISSEAIAVAFLFSAGVGVFFGFYPARRAAGLDPIEALRYE